MTSFLNVIVSIVFHGLAYAMVLYVISVGLSLTMGMLNFVNLAHGVFAMAGGYAALWIMKAQGAPFVLALLVSALLVAVASVVLERLLYRKLYGAGELDQTLMTIGPSSWPLPPLTLLSDPCRSGSIFRPPSRVISLLQDGTSLPTGRF
jgi:branched-chain amino acid transport system permease protein